MTPQDAIRVQGVVPADNCEPQSGERSSEGDVPAEADALEAALLAARLAAMDALRAEDYSDYERMIAVVRALHKKSRPERGQASAGGNEKSSDLRP